MLAVEILLTVLVGVLFSASVFSHLGWLALVLLLGTLGFASTGVVFSAALLRSRSREALLGALLFPIVIPVLLAASRATACLFDPLSPDLEPVAFWTRFLWPQISSISRWDFGSSNPWSSASERPHSQLR
jgi:heme exporter protein B